MKMEIRTVLWLSLTTVLTAIAISEFYTILLTKAQLHEVNVSLWESQRARASVTTDLALMLSENHRLSQIVLYSAEYKIPAGLAAQIFDAAISEGIDPHLGFRLVDVESAFDCRAISHAGAIGCAQVLPSTALDLDPHMRMQDLFEPEYNLHLGFRYLGQLLEEYEGDMRLALLAYNRGPSRVNGLLALGEDPANGYAIAVCQGPCNLGE